jgi:hypoxanthine phosphoribosyltransferase
MTEKPVNSHEHTGKCEITWERFGEMCKELARKISDDYTPECIVGISKGGLPLAAVLASMFRIDLYPIRLSYREKDQRIHTSPQWTVHPPDKVRNKKILLVDEITVSGETLLIATREILAKGAKEVRTCTLSIHSHSTHPDYYILKTDELIVQPWDKWILTRGVLELHPEYKK